jgi:hypothetical protein
MPTAPPVHVSDDLKAHCFDYLALLERLSLYNSTELITAFEHITSSTYNATLESATIFSSICSTFFLLDNFISLGFRTHLGVAIYHFDHGQSSHPQPLMCVSLSPSSPSSSG